MAFFVPAVSCRRRNPGTKPGFLTLRGTFAEMYMPLMIDRHRLLWAFLALAAAALVGARAVAHDWYPIECCHSIDCAPVDHVEVVAGVTYYANQAVDRKTVPPSVMIVTTKMGTAVVPPNLPRRESKDNRMHACMLSVWLSAAGPTKEVTCIFVPPTM